MINEYVESVLNNYIVMDEIETYYDKLIDAVESGTLDSSRVKWKELHTTIRNGTCPAKGRRMTYLKSAGKRISEIELPDLRESLKVHF